MHPFRWNWRWPRYETCFPFRIMWLLKIYFSLLLPSYHVKFWYAVYVANVYVYVNRKLFNLIFSTRLLCRKWLIRNLPAVWINTEMKNLWEIGSFYRRGPKLIFKIHINYPSTESTLFVRVHTVWTWKWVTPQPWN